MRRACLINVGAACAGTVAATLVAGGAFAGAPAGSAIINDAIHQDVSPPLRLLANRAAPVRPTAPRAIPLRPIPLPANTSDQADGALQAKAGKSVGTKDMLNFAGVGQGDYGFSDSYAPPDTNGAAGATQYVQIVNADIGIFDKATGALVMPVFPTNTIWAGFGGACESQDDGDGVLKYDRIAKRWVVTQLAVSSEPYTECIAVSQTSDATGAYNRYSYSYGSNFNDYPKIAVWPDAYYITYNIFANGQSFNGAMLCALDRAKMLKGKAAKQQCFQLSRSYGSVLPSDLDGKTPPPTGSPDYMVNYGSNSLNLWQFHVDWTTPKNSTLTGPVNIAVPAFSALCGGGTCVPQKGTTQTLDSLADRLMYRFAYRNFGDHESLVVNHSVRAGSSGGVRWYELRSPGTTPTLYQSGTFAPDSAYRWMGSVAMDKVGDLAVGYSVSSATQFPAIAYTGRVPTDPLGTLEGEKTVITGSGSQTTGLSRWGDYSGMSLDPADDCTFFYTNEYLKTSGTFNWSTEIHSFKFPACK